MKFIIVFSFSFLCFVNFVSCDMNEPLPQGALGLTLEDVSCTEAWLQLTTNNIQLPATINLLKNNSVTQTFTLSTKDSLLYIDSLLPNQTYKLQVSRIQNPVSSNELSVTTMDTTSHNFTWQIFEFGIQTNVSRLFDVAIISENNIWAVGEIYMNDSLGNPDPMPYNAAHWGGSDWELKKIAVTYNGIETIAPLKGIFALPTGEIIFSSGLPYLPQGNGWKLYHLWDMGVLDQNDGSVDRIWGTSINDLYFTGSKGTIVHYQNGSWTKIESGTTTNINDIWSVIDQSNNQQMVYSAVSFVAQTGDKKILKIQNNKVDSLHWNTGRRIHSVWTFNNRYLYAAGGGIFENRRGYWNEITEVPLYYSRNIRGTDNNNIFVCGDFGLFAHFSGTSWKTYNELYIQGIYYSLSAKNNIVITVGFNGNKAIIMKGTRN